MRIMSRLMQDWRSDFGLEDWAPPRFIGSAADLGAGVGQANALRRAFTELHIDGAFCLNDSPVIYFKAAKHFDNNQVRLLHRQFWNQGISPILVLVDESDVR